MLWVRLELKPDSSNRVRKIPPNLNFTFWVFRVIASGLRNATFLSGKVCCKSIYTSNFFLFFFFSFHSDFSRIFSCACLVLLFLLEKVFYAIFLQPMLALGFIETFLFCVHVYVCITDAVSFSSTTLLAPLNFITIPGIDALYSLHSFSSTAFLLKKILRFFAICTFRRIHSRFLDDNFFYFSGGIFLLHRGCKKKSK